MTITPTGSNDPQKTREIGSARPSRAARSQARPDEASTASTSSVQVSARGERFVSLRARLEQLEASRAERIERLKQLVAEGAYHPDSEAVAAAMLADPATAAALGMRKPG